MPARKPGSTFAATATKATQHNHPAVELNHGGVAAKTQQVAAAVPSIANAEAAVRIAIEEDFVIMLDGVHTIDSSLLPEGARAGSRLWIDPLTNRLSLTAEIGEVHPAVRVTIAATGGEWQLTIDGEQTARVRALVTAAELLAAIEALSNVQHGDVTVTGGPGNSAPLVITFVAGEYADGPAPAITATRAELTGGEESSTVASATTGVTGTEAVKWGVVDSIDRDTGLADVNLNERSSF